MSGKSGVDMPYEQLSPLAKHYLQVGYGANAKAHYEKLQAQPDDEVSESNPSVLEVLNRAAERETGVPIDKTRLTSMAFPMHDPTPRLGPIDLDTLPQQMQDEIRTHKGRVPASCYRYVDDTLCIICFQCEFAGSPMDDCDEICSRCDGKNWIPCHLYYLPSPAAMAVRSSTGRASGQTGT